MSGDGADGGEHLAAGRDRDERGDRFGAAAAGDNPVDGVDNSISDGGGIAGHTGLEQSAPPRREQSATGGDESGTARDAAASEAAPEDAPDGAGERLRGADLARSALQAARSAARDSGRAPPGARQPRATRRGGGRRRRGWSGSRGDDRDPQPLGRLASRLVAERGWTARVSGGQVFGRWEQLVGEEIAEHARPVALRDGELTVQASSTAWATQLRLLQRQLLGRITAGVGRGVVTRLRVLGPAAPSWHHGPRHVRGRGPRDTYG